MRHTLLLTVAILLPLLSPAAQLHLNFGAAPNDGTGDGLRTTFAKIETNFNNLFTNGSASDNTKIAIQSGTGNQNTLTNLHVLGSGDIAGVYNLGNGLAPGVLAITSGSTQYVGIDGEFIVQGGGDLHFKAGVNPLLPARLLLEDTNSYMLFSGGAGIYDAEMVEFWNFNLAPNPNRAARLGEVTNALRNPPVQSIATNTVITIDLSSPAPLLLCSTSIAYNVTLLITNIAPGRSANFSLRGPAGSNAVSYVWPPGTLATWPTDPDTDVPVTNNYVRTNCYLELSLLAYDTNNVRINGKLFK